MRLEIEMSGRRAWLVGDDDQRVELPISAPAEIEVLGGDRRRVTFEWKHGFVRTEQFTLVELAAPRQQPRPTLCRRSNRQS